MRTIKQVLQASNIIGLTLFLFAFSYTNAQVLTNNKFEDEFTTEIGKH